jgi:NAD(P)-dependent dehydrogenase (short-subunit alcohol dehydrogenase family)
VPSGHYTRGVRPKPSVGEEGNDVRNDNRSMDGQTVVVFGGSSGIGLATAAAARDRGADVVITGRSEDRLRTAAGALGDEDATRALFADLAIVHHIFVSAGAVGGGPLGAPMTTLRPLLETRVWGSVFAATHGAAKMAEGGSITLCSGVSGLRPRPGGSSVASASCGAVEALARSLAVELAPIRVNTVVPGLVDTPLLDGFFGDQREAGLAAAGARLPVQRVGTPEDIADAVLFLMGNGYVTGISLIIDGGRLLV